MSKGSDRYFPKEDEQIASGRMKEYSTSLVIKEMKIKIIMRYLFNSLTSRKLEILRECFMQRWAQKRTAMVWT